MKKLIYVFDGRRLCVIRILFTLIELLIVISIIMILMTMLLPALSKVRSRAKAAYCSNSLKTLGQYFLFYSQDYDGLLPNYGNQAKTMFWYTTGSNSYLEPYLDSATKNTEGKFWIGFVGRGYQGNQGRSPLSCPSFEYKGSADWDWLATYGPSLPIAYAGGNPFTDMYYGLSRCTTPSKSAMLYEVEDTAPRVTSGNAASRHMNGAGSNVIYLDMHLDTKKRTQLINEMEPAPTP